MRARTCSAGAPVLYELLTGRRAFRRETPAETMTAILHEDPPDLAVTGVDASPSLARIVRHCLEKNPRERFQTAQDVVFALETESTSTSLSKGTTLDPIASKAAAVTYGGRRWCCLAASSWRVPRCSPLAFCARRQRSHPR